MKDNKILWVIVISVIIIIGLSVLNKPKEEGLKMGVILYDEYGNEIKTMDEFAIVEGTPGVSSIALKVDVQNIGDVSLGCYIEGTTLFLETAFNENYIYIGEGEAIILEPYTDWYTFLTAPMSADALVVDTVDGIYTFRVWIACFDVATGGDIFHESQEGILDLSIEPDFAGFNVNVRHD